MTRQQTKEIIKRKQQYLLLGALAVLGIILLSLGNSDGQIAHSYTATDTQIQSTVQPSEYTDAVTAMEQKLAHTLAQIQNAGTVTVQISVKNTGRKEYAVNTQHTSRTTTEESGDTHQQTNEEQQQITVVQQNQNGTQNPLLVDELMPEIVGVLVVASGAQHAAVQEQLLHAVSALLQIPVHQIVVVPGEERA